MASQRATLSADILVVSKRVAHVSRDTYAGRARSMSPLSTTTSDVARDDELGRLLPR